MNDQEALQKALARALAQGQVEQARALGLEMAGAEELDYPVFHSTLQLLGYENRLQLLNQMMAIAWPQIRGTSSYRTLAIEAYAAQATDHIIYEYLTNNPEPDARSPSLLARLERYFPVDAERLAPYLALLTGRVGRQWRPEEFNRLEIDKLNGLLVEFVGYAHSREDVGYGRAHLAREQLPRYLMDRRAGNLYPRQQFGGRPQPPPPRPDHPLCPDYVTLEDYLQKMMQTVHPLPHAAAALLELAPSWLRFLEWRRLVDGAHCQGSLEEVEALQDSWQKDASR